MCTHKTLSKSRNGYIIFCTKSKHYQIGFGTSLISMNEYEYAEFYHVANEQFIEHKKNGMEMYKNIQLPTFSHNSLMILSYVELHQLMKMLSEAKIMKEVDSILHERNINYQ